MQVRLTPVYVVIANRNGTARSGFVPPPLNYVISSQPLEWEAARFLLVVRVCVVNGKENGILSEGNFTWPCCIELVKGDPACAFQRSCNYPGTGSCADVMLRAYAENINCFTTLVAKNEQVSTG